MNESIKLTEYEKTVINYLETNVGDLDDWFFVDEHDFGMKQSSKSGVISSLVKKEIVVTNGKEIALAASIG